MRSKRSEWYVSWVMVLPVTQVGNGWFVVPFERCGSLRQRGECRLVTPTQETRTWWTRRKL